MKIELTEQQFRYLLDLVYIGNWVMNSTRENDRIQEYDQVESLIFSHCLHHKMGKLVELYRGELIPSRAFADGGIHEAIMAYEDVTFFEILAEELAMRDLGEPTRENYDVLCEVPITFTQAALGAEIEVPTLDGKVKFEIPEGTQTGKEFVLRDKGIPEVGNSRRRGNHRFTVVVETPTRLTREQKELLRQLEGGAEETPKRKRFGDMLKDLFD